MDTHSGSIGSGITPAARQGLRRYRLAHDTLGRHVRRTAQRMGEVVLEALVGIGGPGMHVGMLMAIELGLPVHLMEDIGNGLEWYGPQPRGRSILLCAAEESDELRQALEHLQRREYVVKTLVAERGRGTPGVVEADYCLYAWDAPEDDDAGAAGVAGVVFPWHRFGAGSA